MKKRERTTEMNLILHVKLYFSFFSHFENVCKYYLEAVISGIYTIAAKITIVIAPAKIICTSMHFGGIRVFENEYANLALNVCSSERT